MPISKIMGWLNKEKNFKEELKFIELRDQMKYIAKILFPSWKKHLNPTQKQIDMYLNKLGDVPKIPLTYKLIGKSPVFGKILTPFAKSSKVY